MLFPLETIPWTAYSSSGLGRLSASLVNYLLHLPFVMLSLFAALLTPQHPQHENNSA